MSSGLSSASTTADRRSIARDSAALAVDPECARTGVTTVIVSSTASKAMTSVGRTRIASGMPIGSWPGLRQVLHQPHHVVTEIAEHAGGHRRQSRGQRDAAFGDDVAQRCERRIVGRHKSSRIGERRAVDLGALAVDAKDEIRLEPDDRIAAAHRAAFDQLQKKAHRPSAGDLEKCRDRRFQIGDQSGPDELRLAGRVTRREGLRRRLDLHYLSCIELESSGPLPEFPMACASAAPLMLGAEIGFEPRHILADHVVGHLPLHRSARRSWRRPNWRRGSAS